MKVGDYLVADLFGNGSETLSVIIGKAGYSYPKSWFSVRTTIKPNELFIFAPTMKHRAATDADILKARLTGLCP
jgi:hypothetical protein